MSRSRRKSGWVGKLVLVGATGVLLAGGWWGWRKWRDVTKPHPRPLQIFPFRGRQISCDVMVVGGTPSGVAAALAAARHGAKVVLVEERPRLGGDVVYAMLNMFDVPMHKDGSSPVAQAIFGEFFQKLGLGFDVIEARKLFEAKVAEEPNIRLLTRYKLQRVLKKGKGAGYVVGARFTPLNAPGLGVVQVNARCTVDSTNDASFASLAGANSWLGRQQSGTDDKMQAAGLLFSVTNVNWRKMRQYVNATKLVPLREPRLQPHASVVGTPSPPSLVPGGKTTPLVRLNAMTDVRMGKLVRRRLGGGSGNYIWERGEIIKGYVPRGKDVEVLSINFGKQQDGSVVLNTLNAVNVNGLKFASQSAARGELTRELNSFLPWLRQKMPGMKNARLKLLAPSLYIRETRHIQGYYTLTVEDIRAQRTFEDSIGRVSYPIDLHPYTKGQLNPYGPKRYFYTLPLRSMVPRAVDGVFVASRSLSATYSAAGSARVIPITMVAGQGCGVAAWLCASQNTSPQQMAQNPAWWDDLQSELRSDGVIIEAAPEGEPVGLKPEPIVEPTPTPRATPTPDPNLVPGLTLRDDLGR